MSSLDTKLLRDFRRMWAQVVAIALVLASGVATLVLAMGALRSLEETRSAYYDRYRFADLFATVTRAPNSVADRLAEISGIAAVDTGIRRFSLLDIEGLGPPATGLAISLPDHGEPRLNRLYLRVGRMPEATRTDEVVVNEALANAHRFMPGARFSATLNGRKRQLTIVGVALSPEFIYALGPGDIMPDDRRYGIFWMSGTALASIFDLDGAFNSAAFRLLPGVSEASVIEQIDRVLTRYGGAGAIARKDQMSHAFLDAELKQLTAMARVMPPIFLLVSAFLINMTLSRLIALEREQIGLLKAIGYRPSRIALHYVELVLAIAALGILVGFVAGGQLGRGLTRLYGDFFHFPFLIFQRDPGVYLLAATVSVVAAVAGALRAVLDVLRLSPAIAMQPPAPPRYRRMFPSLGRLLPATSMITTMALRHMARWPARAGFTLLGIALACGLMVTALLSFDSIEQMIDIAFNRTERQHASLEFGEPRHHQALTAVAAMPGVLRAEPSRSAMVRLRNGHLSRQLSISGKPDHRDLSRVLDVAYQPVELPETGLAVSERVAEILGLRQGDSVTVEALEGKRRMLQAPVTDIIKSTFGLTVFMRMSALDDLLDEGPRISRVHVTYDKAREAEFFAAIKATPAIAGAALQQVALARFRETLAQNINYMVTVYTSLAIIITFGVVYNSARIQLSERARELASLRVLGFTRTEVSRVLLTELAILTFAAVPLGWLFGYGFGWLLIKGFSSDLYRVPFVIERGTYAIAALIVLAAASVSALIVRRRVDRLDLVAVLKTRD
jgi:putative ABC transport system permease protein